MYFSKLHIDIYHRDIRPENIVMVTHIDNKCKPMLIDFALAIQGSRTLFEFAGTPVYSSKYYDAIVNRREVYRFTRNDDLISLANVFKWMRSQLETEKDEI